ncbi:uncharacterized protein LOC142331688 [Lycorma delicatula]|uniref:uncharacterized protein LOC142331688 n=1 Tax=Lycorma delicatula TaxID=130591 RepID=UPI003F512646
MIHITGAVVLCAIQSVRSVSIQLSTQGDGTGGGGSPLALYQAPPTYKEPGKPRLNSIIIKSKPYLINGSFVSNLNDNIHQIQSGKSWRREAVEISPITILPQERTDEITTTQSTTVIDDLATIPQYTIDCTGEKQTCSETISITESTTAAPTFKPYSQEELEKYLYQATMSSIPKSKVEEKPTNKLASIYIEDEAVNVLETTPDPSLTDSQNQDKSKSWNLVNSQTHKHPYDDRNGWVSLEPIPWSSSQIQKWEPNPHTRPQIPSWPEPNRPWSKPSHSSRPNEEYNRPSWHKPVYDYSKPVLEHYQKPSSGWNYNQESLPDRPYQGGGGSWGSSSDIVTDGRPGYFPADKRPWQEQSSASYHRPTQVIYQKPSDSYNGHNQHNNHGPGDSDGHWVLLSSTKGYSTPQRHRSFQRSLKTEDFLSSGSSNSDTETSSRPNGDTGRSHTMKSHRTVRLTVLPPLNGTTNTTVSHGGLIEVEQTHQTVDEAHREHMAKMMNLWKLERKESKNFSENKSPPGRITAEKRIGSMKVVAGKPLRASNSRNNAVLAAVGAGMIPATVAMLLPMVLGRRRRDTEEGSRYSFLPSSSSADVENSARRRKPIKKLLNQRKKTQVVYY